MTFKRVGSSIKVVYDNSKRYDYDCHAVYIGTISGSHMSGTMSTDGNSDCIATPGTWFATRASTDSPATAGHGALRANGQR